MARRDWTSARRRRAEFGIAGRRADSGPQASAPQATGSIDRSEQPGRVGLLLVLAGLLVGAAIGLSFVANEQAQSLIVGLLALLAMAGVFFLFALAIGALQLSGSATRDDTSPRASSMPRRRGAWWSRTAAGDLCQRGLSADRGGDTFSNLMPVERILVGPPEVSEAVFRLSQASRDARAHTEEVRMSPPLGTSAGERSFGWYRVSVRPLARPRRAAALWTVADITAERERQENVFQELQHAIDYLDHAPAGFLSIDPAGAIVYMNATLAAWLGYDLASVGPGGPHLTEIAPEADVLVRTAGCPARSAPTASTSTCAAATATPCRCGSTTGSPSARTASPALAHLRDQPLGRCRDRRAAARRRGAPRPVPQQFPDRHRDPRQRRADRPGHASFTRLFGTVARQAEDGALEARARCGRAECRRLR